MIILSVLIPTIPTRAKMFGTLLCEIRDQIREMNQLHQTLGKIEVLYDESPGYLDGGPSIGKKREALVKRAEGKYLCFLDDDESISGNYVETLVRLCQHDRDVCTFRSFARLESYWTLIDMGLKYPNDQACPDFIVRRRPWHICPVRSLFAKLHSFEDSNYGEDFSWMEKVLTHCTSEAKSEAIIHMYNHGNHSEADKITNHVQSEFGRATHP